MSSKKLFDRPADGSQVLFTEIDGKPKAIVFCNCKHERQWKSNPTKDGATAKTPRGWRKIDGEFVCGDCVSQRFYARSFRVEITGLAGDKVDKYGRTIETFRKQLRAASKEAARYGNWLVQRLFAADPAASTPSAQWPTTKDGKPRLPTLPEVEWYVPQQFADISPATITALAKMVRQWYGERRWEAFVALNRSIENYRFGYLPVEVRAQDWQIAAGDDGRYCFRRIAVQPGPSWDVSVYCDVRNLHVLRQCVDGEAIPLGLKIVRRSKQPIPGSNGKPVKRWFFRVSVLLPRKPRRQSHQEITMTLGHDRGVLLFGALEGDAKPFEFPGVEIRHLIVGGDKSDRLRQQEQAITRGLMPRRMHRRWSTDRTRACENRLRKIDYQLWLAAKALARWCASRHVTSVDYDLTDHGFLPHFPYRALRDRIAMKLEEQGIALHCLDARGELVRSEGQELPAGAPKEHLQEALAGPGSETSA